MTGRAVFVAWLTLAATIANGQSTPQKPTAQQPPFRSGANFVRVDVYPTTDGKPVMDLRAEDFEVFEDNAPQSIQSFEHVVVKSAGPQATRTDPGTIGQSLEMAANPRNRVFVLFLDQKFVQVASSWNIRQPLVRMIDEMLGPDDLIGVMTSSMSAADVTLARKTQVLADGLLRFWPWGERYTNQTDERENQYWQCFPLLQQQDVVGAMIARRRERMTLDAFRELTQYLRNIREERKAIVVVSEGWRLFREDETLTRLREGEQVPGAPEPFNVGPDGRITNRNSRDQNSDTTLNSCWEDRRRLSMIDNDLYFREIVGEANRANASFYTVEPRGLVVFDTPINANVPIATDFAMLRARQETLRTLADGTDGLAVMNSNDMNASLRRITDDLSSYYLLGYNSTNSRLDGKFRNIRVRVKRPGVAVRARKGYRAATEDEVTTARIAISAPVPEIVTAMSSSMGALDRVRPGVRFYINAVPVAGAGTKATSTVFVAGELQPSGPSDPWLKGGTAEIDVRSGGTSATARATVAAGDRGFVVPVALTKPVESGTLEVRVRMTGSDPDGERAIDSVTIDASSAGSRPLLFRRGPTTGNRLQPVATFHFNRSDRARVEVPLGPDMKPGTGRLIDKSGQPLTIPVTLGERTDQASGQRWLTADVMLGALAPADYAIEITATAPGGEQRTVSAIRVLR